mmetsp:Transcript_17582/g.22204  ORF Transcript_17582/g.22204 Transcript_17582/m.22204 type:complete len:200 (+) Transcript_17582:188-787(+)
MRCIETRKLSSSSTTCSVLLVFVVTPPAPLSISVGIILYRFPLERNTSKQVPSSSGKLAYNLSTISRIISSQKVSKGFFSNITSFPSSLPALLILCCCCFSLVPDESHSIKHGQTVLVLPIRKALELLDFLAVSSDDGNGSSPPSSVRPASTGGGTTKYGQGNLFNVPDWTWPSFSMRSLYQDVWNVWHRSKPCFSHWS